MDKKMASFALATIRTSASTARYTIVAWEESQDSLFRGPAAFRATRRHGALRGLTERCIWKSSQRLR
jgi:hypothetical protein